MNNKTSEIRKLTKSDHAWPESIDIDQEGNLYFTDAVKGKLYIIRRTSSGGFAENESCLIKGLKRLTGLSICTKNQMAYMGIRVSGSDESKYRIIGIRLELLSSIDDKPIQYKDLGHYADERKMTISEIFIDDQPNGVVCSEAGDSVFYTYDALNRIGSWFKAGKGYIEKVQTDGQKKGKVADDLLTPNGIDLDRSTNPPSLIVSKTFNNSIHCFVPVDDRNSYKEAHSMDINTSKDTLFGDLPDGLFCMGNGDVLVACFGTGKILYIPKKDNRFGNAVEIKKGLGHATDCVVGPSSIGGSKSLFVTTKRTAIVSFEEIAQGKVVEIPNIEQIIESHR